MFEETGNANLHLTFGALIHKTSSGREARAPLFLIPARIEGGSGRSEFRVTVDPANVATPNHCLVEWLRLKHDVKIDALEQPKLDDSGIDVAYATQAIAPRCCGMRWTSASTRSPASRSASSAPSACGRTSSARGTCCSAARSCRRSGGRRPDVRARGTARNRQVTDDPNLIAHALDRGKSGLHADADARRLAGLVGSPRALSTVLPQVRERLEHEAFGSDELKRVRGAAWRAARTGLVDEIVRFQEQHATVLLLFTPTFLEDGDLAGLRALADDAQKGLCGKKKRAEQFEGSVESLLLAGKTLVPDQVDGLALAVTAARDHAARLLADARDVVRDATPAHWTPLRPDALPRLTSALDTIDRAVAFADAHPDLWARLEEHGAVSEASVRTLEAVAAATDRWLALLGTDDLDLSRWTGDRPWTDAWRTDLPRWSTEVADGGDVPIRRWAQMVAFLDPLRAAGLEEFREALLTAGLPAEEAEVAFLRGSATASVRERRAVGGLDVFDAALRDGEIEDFATAASALREEQTVALPAALIERRPYQAGRLAGPVGELRRKRTRSARVRRSAS